MGYEGDRSGNPLVGMALIGAGVLFVLFIGTWIFACHQVKPDAGHEAVLIHKPWFIGDGGVDPTPIKTGQRWIWKTTDAVEVSMLPQQFTVKFDDIMSSDGVPLDFDSVIRLKVTDSVALISQFGPDWYKANVEAEFANRVRQAVRKRGMNETAISTTAIDEIDAEVSAAMVKYIEEANLPLQLVQVTVGKANPPDSVKSQRVATAQEQQRALTENQRKLAEDQRKAAEESRAAADNAYRNMMTLSAEQFLRLEAIKMQKEVCIYGHCTFITGASVSPVVNAGQ